MATKRHTNFELDSDEQLYETSTLPLEVRPEQPQPTKVNFLPLPNYAVDRRSDVRARDYDNAIQLPYTDGYLEKFKRIASPGFYLIELRAGNKIVGDEGVLEMPPTMHGAEPAPAAIQAPAPATQSAPSSNPAAREVNAAAETAEAFHRLAGVLTPKGQPAPQLTEEKIGEIVAREMSKHAPQQSAPAQPDPFSFIERAIKLQKEMQPPQQPAPAATSPADTMEQTASLLETMLGISERFAPPQPSGDGWLNGIANILNALGVKDIAKPLGQIATAALLSRGIQMPNAAAPQMPQFAQMQPQPVEQFTPSTQPQPVAEIGPAPVGESTDEENSGNGEKLTFESLLSNFALDILENKPPKECINETVTFVSENPEYLITVQQILELPNGNILTLLTQTTGKNLSVISNADKFVDQLKKGVRARLAPAPVQAAPVAMNGNGAQHITQAEQAI
jgi:hypothetical protein